MFIVLDKGSLEWIWVWRGLSVSAIASTSLVHMQLQLDHLSAFAYNNHEVLCISLSHTKRLIWDTCSRRLYAIGATLLEHNPNCTLHASKHTQASTMNRLFGAKNNAPKPTLNSAISNVCLYQNMVSTSHQQSS